MSWVNAIGVPVLIIIGKIEDVPFDYKHKGCILYNRGEAGCDKELRAKLFNNIQVVLAKTTSEDPFR